MKQLKIFLFVLGLVTINVVLTFMFMCGAFGRGGGMSEKPLYAGTAFFISTDGYLVTANHVVGDRTKNAILYNHQLYPVKVVAKSSYYDIALLKANLHPTNYLPLDMPRNSGQGAILGYPGGITNLTLTTGTYKFGGIFVKSLNNNIKACHGNSGGPIIDQNGNAIGVLQRGVGVQIFDECSDRTAGTDVGYVLGLTHRYGIPVQSSNIPKSFDFWLKKYNDSVVLIYSQ